MTQVKLESQIIIKGTITIKTGLHIGGSKESIEIGGMDNPIIKNPITAEPYIPGSSLKGKMRSLLELKHNKTQNGKPCSCGECFICKIFGCGETRTTQFPTSMIVRDCHLNREKTKEKMESLEDNFTPYDIIEEKTENSINRIKGVADSQRSQERVVPGTVFDMEIIFRKFDYGDNTGDLLKYLKEAMELLKNDYLGGGGSRGCGKIEFDIENADTIFSAK